MIAFWMMTGLAAALAALLVMTGARRGADPAAGAETQAGSREIEELDRLKARGLLDDAAYASARAEAGRRLLAMTTTATPVAGPKDRFWVLGGIAVTVAGIIVLLPAVFNRLFGLAFRLVRRQPVDPQSLPTFGTIGTGAGLYVVGAMLAGLSMFLVARSLDPSLGWAELTYLIAAMNLASAVSMLAIFAPSGIGVREAILVLLLGVVMSPELALLTAIVLRIWSIIADFAFLGLALAVDRLAGRRQRDL